MNYFNATDKEALEAFKLCCRLEGIIPALEPSHALAFLLKYKNRLSKKDIVIMNMCGRGDKDIFSISSHLEKILRKIMNLRIKEKFKYLKRINKKLLYVL